MRPHKPTEAVIVLQRTLTAAQRLRAYELDKGLITSVWAKGNNLYLTVEFAPKTVYIWRDPRWCPSMVHGESAVV